LANALKTFLIKDMLFLLSSGIQVHVIFSAKSRMDHTCELHLKCLKRRLELRKMWSCGDSWRKEYRKMI